jgi:hypothetical protein
MMLLMTAGDGQKKVQLVVLLRKRDECEVPDSTSTW